MSELSLLRLTEVCKSFAIPGTPKRVQAVNAVTLEIREGETVGLVGESGSGKSTVGRCVVGLTNIDSGTIRFQGKDMRSLMRGDGKGLVQLVFQEPGESFNPTMSVGASIAEPLHVMGVPTKERRMRALRVLEEVGLGGEYLNASPLDLTTGQLQRAAIARAIITDPKLIVLDEPTSSLDPSARAGIVELLKRLQRERGTAYLFISHDLSTVRFLSHKIAVMYLGQIVEFGPADEVFERPQHPYTSGLLGAIMLPNPTLQFQEGVDLEGEIPSPIDLPQGCFLASRCGMAQPLCSAKPVEMRSLDGRRLVRCLRAELLEREVLTDVYAQFQAEARRILSVECLVSEATVAEPGRVVETMV